MLSTTAAMLDDFTSNKEHQYERSDPLAVEMAGERITECLRICWACDAEISWKLGKNEGSRAL